MPPIFKLIPRVFAHILLLIIAFLSVTVTYHMIWSSGVPWPSEENPVEASLPDSGWLCISRTSSHAQLPRGDGTTIHAVGLSGFFHPRKWELQTAYLEENGNTGSWDTTSNFAILFRIATFLLGWFYLARISYLTLKRLLKPRPA